MPAPFVTDLTEIARGYVLAEAPVAASSSGVFFADVRAGGVIRADDDGTTTTVIDHRRGIGGMAAHADGGFVVSGRNVAHKALDQTTTILADRDERAGRFIYNDLTTDRDGRVYVGSFATNTPFDRDDRGRAGALNVIDLDGGLRVLDEDVIAANGMGCSPDGRYLYLVETGRRVLWRYEITGPGQLGGKTDHYDFGADGPDGMAVAEDGSLWIAMATAGCVVVLDAGGHRVGEVVMPAASVTSVCFGGTDGRTVYICTGGHGDGDATGAVYRARSTVPGVAVAPARVPLGIGGALVTGPRTMYQKIWEDHVIDTFPDGTCLLAVDRQMIYEGTSYQAFEGLRSTGRVVRRPSVLIAVPDHLVPTKHRSLATMTEGTRHMVEALEQNCDEHGIPQIKLDDVRQGIVHVVGPEQGFTLPGLVLVCADSHTSTHGAFGSLAFGIGTSELEHVLATQTLTQRPSRTMRFTVHGPLPALVSGKDVALAVIGHIGAAGGTGFSVEFAGEAVEALSMEGRMTLCNMSVEAGARSGMVAPDDKTYEWLRGRPLAPGATRWEQGVAYWRTLPSDPGAGFDAEESLDVRALSPQVTWGTSPEHVVGIDDRVPDPDDAPSTTHASAWTRALEYMDLTPGTAMRDIRIDRAFIGTCTNGRLEDLRAAAAVLRGRTAAERVRAMVTPGSGLVRRDAEREGLDRIFVEAGFEWRQPGCSMCFGSGYDHVGDGERCASTSNRNFEHRQGRGARTHLMSPAMVAAAAVAGRLTDVRDLIGGT